MSAIDKAPLPTRRGLLYSPSRRGYMRATLEEGIRAELDVMTAEASGTPFFATAEAAPPSSHAHAPLVERLALLKAKKP